MSPGDADHDRWAELSGAVRAAPGRPGRSCSRARPLRIRRPPLSPLRRFVIVRVAVERHPGIDDGAHQCMGGIEFLSLRRREGRLTNESGNGPRLRSSRRRLLRRRSTPLLLSSTTDEGGSPLRRLLTTSAVFGCRLPPRPPSCPLLGCGVPWVRCIVVSVFIVEIFEVEPLLLSPARRRQRWSSPPSGALRPSARPNRASVVAIS